MGAGWSRGIAAISLALAALLMLLVIVSAEDDDRAAPTAVSGVDEAKLPELARRMLPVITDVLAGQCPELPAVWVVAEVMAESSWRPHAWSNDSNGGAAGLYQINQHNWIAAGGQAWAGVPPGPTSDIYQPETQLRVGIPWVCANLRAVTIHLAATGKSTTPLDAMAVCHIAGCARVTRSATGIPVPGEAGCGATCVSLIHRYINNIHRYVREFSAPPAGQPPAPDQLAEARPAPSEVPNVPPVTDRPAGPGPFSARPAIAHGTSTVGGITTPALPAPPRPFTGPPGAGCTGKDPTSTGCLAPVTAWAMDQQVAAFGPLRAGPTLRDSLCWFAPPWNPAGDQARGLACDLYPGPASVFDGGAALDRGWRVANWLRSNAGALRVAYVVWQGRYWRPGTADQDGWGQPYDGGGVNDVRDPNGGDFDHVHVGFTS